MREMM